MADRQVRDWLECYLEYTVKQESPEKFHFWTGLCVLSAAMRRNIWLDRGFYKLYPNIFVLLVAESATLKKSSAMDIGLSMIAEHAQDVFYIGGSLTPEGLIKHLNRSKAVMDGKGKTVIQFNSDFLLHADELAELFGFDKTRASKLTILLTKIYGSQDTHTHTTSTDGQLILRNLYPVFLGGTAPQNLKVLPEEAVGGLLGRLIFVTSDTAREPIAWPNPSENDRILWNRLGHDLTGISQLHGEMKKTEAAKECFAEWYTEHSKNKNSDPRVDAFRARCHDTALKIAMLLSISESSSLILTDKHVARGIDYIEKQIPEFSKVAGWATASIYAQNRIKFIDILRRQGGFGTRKSMLKMMALPLEDIIVIEESLAAEQTIKAVVQGETLLYKLIKDILE